MAEASHAALELTDANFATEVANFSGVVLVDFWAAWCGPCQIMAPHIEALAEQYQANPAVKVAKLDVDANTTVAQQESVMSLPTFKVYKDGEAVEMTFGVQPKAALEGLIQKHIAA